MDIQLYTESGENKASFGGLGIRVLTTSSASGEYFHCLYATETSQIDATVDMDAGDTSVTNLVIPAGGAIYGRFTSITVDSGKVVGYLIEA